MGDIMETTIDENENQSVLFEVNTRALYKILNEEDIKTLTKSLEGFHGTDAHLLTLLIRPDQSYSKIQRLLTGYYKYLARNSGNGDGSTETFNRKAVEWVLNKFTGLNKEIPKNGLALFAGVTKSQENSNLKNIVRVMLVFEPCYKLNCSILTWDNEFYADILLHNPITKPKKFGILVLSQSTISVGLYSNDEDVEFDHYTYDAKNIKSGMLKIQKLTGFRFLSEGVPIIMGILIGFTPEINPSTLHALKNIEDLFDSRLFDIASKVLTVSYRGEKGICEVISATSEFRNQAWLSYLKELTEYKKSSELDLFEKETDLKHLLKDMGLGTMEFITEANGLIVKKVESHFANWVKMKN